MKKILLTALSVPMLALSVSANALLVNYESITGIPGTDSRLSGTFTWDTVNSAYTSFDLELVLDGITFSDFSLVNLGNGLSASNFGPLNFDGPVGVSGAGGNFFFADGDVQANVSGAVSPLLINWAFSGGYELNGNIELLEVGLSSTAPSTAFAVSAAPVPEPATYAMMGLGLLTLLGFRRYVA